MKSLKLLVQILILISIVSQISCKAPQILYGSGKAGLRNQIKDSGLLDSHFTGFALYDPAEKNWLYQLNAEKYFTPASNTKILTLYSALQILGDSVEALRYIEDGEDLIFWGTGDPSFLYPEIESPSITVDFLKSYQGNLIYAEPHFTTTRFGDGWAWDDFSYGYQVERTAFPIYGNRVYVTKRAFETEPEISPPYFASWFSFQEQQGNSRYVLSRKETVNAYAYDFSRIKTHRLERTVPFISDPYLVKTLLEDTLGRSVEVDYNFNNTSGDYKVLHNTPSDTLYKHMMQVSDNFIAEQLILLCGHKLFDTLDTDRAIDSIQERFFRFSPDRFLWYDGSGLSRYNMFTPRSIVWLLDQLMDLRPIEDLKQIFAVGGDSGTIKDWYGSTDPYVWAKTGTLRNKHALSGYLETDSGRLLIFSFMHNNYPGSSSNVKPDMQKILEYIKMRY